MIDVAQYYLIKHLQASFPAVSKRTSHETVPEMFLHSTDLEQV